ncbi:MAG: hypothetical protein QF664_05060 [Dehalococcoidia bacterium]|nr:hypothetical protein [Dehalococcoidia bacterium]
MNRYRLEYQDRINFVILDFDVDEEVALAHQMGIAAHPVFGVVPPDGGPEDVAQRSFGPLNTPSLGEFLESMLARFPN